jgi:16S rRNA C967 or C1407 C5-methylase (RsmB/RsmF family)
MNLLLDLHIFLWLANEPHRLSPSTMAALRAPGNRRYLSIVSVWELQIKVSSGKLTLPTSVQHFVATYRSANSIYPLSISESHIWALATLPFHHRDPFDRILIDAPCTGIGALRRRPEVRWRRTLQDLKNLTTLQSELMDAAALHLKSEGVLAYVTCSSHQAETKFQIRSFLKRNAEFTRVPIEDSRSDEDGELQLWPHRDNCDAMFLSMLQKG